MGSALLSTGDEVGARWGDPAREGPQRPAQRPESYPEGSREPPKNVRLHVPISVNELLPPPLLCKPPPSTSALLDSPAILVIHPLLKA